MLYLLCLVKPFVYVFIFVKVSFQRKSLHIFTVLTGILINAIRYHS